MADEFPTEDRLPLVGKDKKPPCWKNPKYICTILFVLGIIAGAITVCMVLYMQAYHRPISLKIMSLNCWGTPASLGSQDKEDRMKEIGAKIGKKEYDIYLLEELWMRPDHFTIKQLVPEGYFMTEIHELGPYGTCDGRVSPAGCAGLAIISKYPFKETEFNVFSVHGDFWWTDGEFEARKGVGRVRIEPQPNVTVDVFVTHTAASDYNSYYRQIQTREVVDHVKNSTADFAILGGDFNIDPRMKNESTYEVLTTELRSAMQEFFIHLQELLEPHRATYGNPANSYSANYGPQLYDYIFHRAKGNNAVVVNLFDVPALKAYIGGRVSSGPDGHQQKVKRAVEAVAVEVDQSTFSLKSLSDHEAITSHLLLFKYRWP